MSVQAQESQGGDQDRAGRVQHRNTAAPGPAAGETAQDPGNQAEFDKRIGEGYLTRAVTGYEENDGQRFAAFWNK